MLLTIRESGLSTALLYLITQFFLYSSSIFIYVVFGTLIDTVIAKDQKSFLFWSLLLVLFYLGRALLAFVTHFLKRRYSSILTLRLRERVINFIIESEDPYKIITRSPGNFLPWVIEEISTMEKAIFSISNIINSSMSAILIFIIVGSINLWILLSSFFLLLIGFVLPALLSKIFEKLGKSFSDLEREHSDIALNFFKGFHLFLIGKRVANFTTQLLRISKRIYASKQKNEVQYWSLFFFLDFVYLTILLVLSALLIMGIYYGFFPISTFIIVVNVVAIAHSDIDSIKEETKNILSTRFLFSRFKINNKRSRCSSLIRDLEPFQKLSIQNLTLSFGKEQLIFSNLSLEIEKGQKYLITAPSGSGKSSLSFIITGLLNNYSGEIFWNTLSYQEISPILLREKIYLLNHHSQILAASVFDNITLFNQSIPKKRITELLDLVGLGNFKHEDRISDNLISKGQAQRIALARALLADKEILILDEALSAVDFEERSRIENFLLAQKRLTVINFSHQMPEKSQYNQVIDLTQFMELRQSLRGEDV